MRMSESEYESTDEDKEEEKKTTAALRLLVGDELGVMRLVEIPSNDRWHGAKIVQKWGPSQNGQPDKSLGIVALAATSKEGITDTESSTICVSRQDGTVEVFGGSEILESRGVIEPPKVADFDKGPKHQVNFLHPFWKNSDDRVPSILSCTTSGLAQLHCLSNESNLVMEKLMSFQAADNISASAVDEKNSSLLVGGDGCHIRLYDLETHKLAFNGKSSDNPYQLQKRNWTSACALVPQAGCKLLMAGTADHEVRLYDVRAGRRPVTVLDWKESRIMTMAPESNGREVWMANATGHIDRFDVRKKCVRGSLKGRITGSIRSLALHPDRPLVASAGLDRYLRLHDTQHKSLRIKLYVKYQCTSVCFMPVPEGYEGECETEEPVEEVNPEAELCRHKQTFSPPRLGKKRPSSSGSARGRLKTSKG